MTPTAIYQAVMLAVEERRQALGLSMWQVNDGAGLQDGFYAKMLHAHTPSGRQAQWPTLQLVIDFLFSGGFDLRLVAAPIKKDMGTPELKRQLMFIKATHDPKTRRQLMAEIGKKGREKQLQTYDKKTLSKIARKAQRARRRRERENRKARRNAPSDPSLVPPSQVPSA